MKTPGGFAGAFEAAAGTGVRNPVSSKKPGFSTIARVLTIDNPPSRR